MSTLGGKGLTLVLLFLAFSLKESELSSMCSGPGVFGAARLSLGYMLLDDRHNF